jgi:predicted RNA-binding Zn ribbon-like protein
VDLTCYADLAVRLVNTAPDVGSEPDWLESADSFRMHAASHPLLAGPCTLHDRAALRMLRTGLARVFAAAAERDQAAAAAQLNALLVQFPVRPVLVRHDRSRWHLHLDDSGSVSDRYAAAAVTGLSTIVSQFGMSHIGLCTMPGCRNAFADDSPGRPSRHCADHSAARPNVTSLPGHRAAQRGYSASTAAS